MISSTEVMVSNLSAAQVECIACIAGHMIPASPEFGVPAANDPAILADLISIIDHRDHAAIAGVVADVDEAAGGSLCALPAGDQIALLARLRAEHPGFFASIESVVARAYYRDDRVLRSIGVEVRPPFPQGYDIEDSDWALLDPVSRRGKIYREAD